jgi:hypothetical protein
MEAVDDRPLEVSLVKSIELGERDTVKFELPSLGETTV